ncbi:MAG: hypothetical protein GY788_24805 [bacterium]|nr:hypothetical protein [bacterium]
MGLRPGTESAQERWATRIIASEKPRHLQASTSTTSLMQCGKSKIGILLLAIGMVAQPSLAAVFDVTNYGADPAFAGIDSDGAQAAVDAACAAGGGEVHFPAGFYRLGREHGAGGAFYSGLQLTCDNLVVTGVGNASVLMPLNSGGQVVIIICSAFLGGDWKCDFTNSLQNITIRDLKIWDDDPEAHCVIQPDGSCASEESHGIMVRNGHNILLERLTLDSLGDESITFGGGSSAGVVQDSTFVNCPSLISGGGCVEFDWGSGFAVMRNDFDGGVAGSSAMIYVNNHAANEVSDVVILDNDLTDSSTLASETVSAGIFLGPHNADLQDIWILDNTISNDQFGSRSIMIATSAFSVINLNVHDNVLAGRVDVASTNLHDLEFKNNVLTADDDTGAAALRIAGNDLVVEHNLITSPLSQCIEIGGMDGGSSDILIRGKACASSSGSTSTPMIGVWDIWCGPLGGVDSGLSIIGNWLVPLPPGGTIKAGIYLPPCSTASVKDNVLVLGTSDAPIGIHGGATISGNHVEGADDAVRTATTLGTEVSDNTLKGDTCVRMVGTMNAIVHGNDLATCGTPLREQTGATNNACWNNEGMADGCSLLLECHDGLDNDGDGQIDALDSNCSPTRPSSESAFPVSCGVGFELAPVLIGLGVVRRRRTERARHKASGIRSATGALV